MRAAENQIERLNFPEQDAEPEEYLYPHTALKQQVAERLAAHRSRRQQTGSENLIAISPPKPAKARTNRIASAVAERYAQTQTYRDFLAAEASRAIEAANAAAEIAARNAEAVTVAQQQLLAELENWIPPEFEEGCQPVIEVSAEDQTSSQSSSIARSTPARPPDTSPKVDTQPQTAPLIAASVQHPVAGLTVRLYEDVGMRQPQIKPARASNASLGSTDHEEEESFLDEEIAFRQTPVFAEPAGPTVAIHANLIEFPRQLVAPRKSRPRLAEGPLREEANVAPASAQLRIFEVEPDQISTAPSPGAGVETVVPEWSSIHLDAAPAVVAQEAQEELYALLPLETASLNLRLMAAAVDGCILGFTFLFAAAAFASRAVELPSLLVAAVTSAATLLVLFILYHLLFFTLSDATPGMRYARIGLCTFSDENPTRAQMRRRTWAMLLSACPLGIGFLWALLDDDRLGWHDRISRMYQRGY